MLTEAMAREVKWPVYIPSRGRYATATTPRLLLRAGMSVTLVVEPQEQDEYRRHFPEARLLVMEKSSQGIAYARNQCLDDARLRGFLWHWEVDDNIRGFAIRQNGRNVRCSPCAAFSLIEQSVDLFVNVAAAGMKHQAFAFAEKKAVSINRQVYTSMLIRTDTGHHWRNDVIEDTDFNLQLLASGWCTMLFNRIVMDKAETMSMAGGNTEISYTRSGRMLRATGLQKKWPGHFKIRETSKGPRIAPSSIWRRFQQQPIRKGTLQAHAFLRNTLHGQTRATARAVDPEIPQGQPEQGVAQRRRADA